MATPPTTLLTPTPHDQIVKELLLEFLPQLVALVCPQVPQTLFHGEPVPASQESFTQSPRGAPRRSDVAQRYPQLVVHVESEERQRDPLDQKMFQHGAALLQRHPVPLVPIALCFMVGEQGQEITRVCYVREVAGLPVLSFTYWRMNVCGLLASDYLAKDNPLGYALAARMRPGPLSRPQLRAECIRKIMQARVRDRGRYLLLHYVRTYVKLNPDEEKEYKKIMEQVEYAEAREGELSWSEEVWRAARKDNFQKGIEQGAMLARQTIQDMCELIGIKLTAARQAELEGMDLDHLSSLRQYLKTHRAWPRKSRHG